MPDIPTPEQVEAIRERAAKTWGWLRRDSAEADRDLLLAAYDALTAEVQQLRDALAPDGSLERLADTYTAEGTDIVLRRMADLRRECDEWHAWYDEARRVAVAAERKVEAVREALAGHPRCDVHPDGDPIACGWKRAVADVQAVLDGEDA